MFRRLLGATFLIFVLTGFGSSNIVFDHSENLRVTQSDLNMTGNDILDVGNLGTENLSVSVDNFELYRELEQEDPDGCGEGNLSIFCVQTAYASFTGANNGVSTEVQLYDVYRIWHFVDQDRDELPTKGYLENVKPTPRVDGTVIAPRIGTGFSGSGISVPVGFKSDIDMAGNYITNVQQLTTRVLTSDVNSLLIKTSLNLQNKNITGVATMLADKIYVDMIDGTGFISVNETINMKGNDIINVGNLDQEQKGGGYTGGYTKGVYNLNDKNPLPMSDGYLGEGKIKLTGGVVTPYPSCNCDFESKYVNVTVEYQDGTEDNAKLAGKYNGEYCAGSNSCSRTFSWSDPFDNVFSNEGYPFDVEKKVSEIYTDYQGSGASVKIAYEAASDGSDLSTKSMQATSPDAFNKNTSVRNITNPKDIGVLEINAKVTGQSKFPWKDGRSYCVYTDKNENSQASAKAVLKDDNGNTEEVVSLNPQNSPRPNLRVCEKESSKSIKRAADIGLSEISEIELIAQGDAFADSTVTASWESY